MPDPASRPSDRSVLDRLHPDTPVWSPALTRIRSPRSVRMVIGLLAMLLPTLLVAGTIVPWQQTASATGQVIAYAPEERQQHVEAPVSGRVEEWFVREGQAVQKGDPLVELRDNDPDLLARLERQLDATTAEREAAERQITSYELKLDAARAARDLVVAEKDAKLQESRRKRTGEAAELEAAHRNLQRTLTLASEGIVSERKLELAHMKEQKAASALDARDRELDARRNARDKAGADGEAKIASVRAELESARSKLASATRKQLDLEVKLARQTAQVVVAPRDGTVLRLHGGLGAGQIKAGDPVATLVPDMGARAVELSVDGNDMPFVKEGSAVRLVFEGWPALQLVALPGSGQGTFAGKVAFIDASADGKGRFRAVVVPDGEWPDVELLRQGARAKGFLLLGQVSLGYELWRQLNGFPPSPDVEKGDKPVLPTNKKPRAPGQLQ